MWDDDPPPRSWQFASAHALDRAAHTAPVEGIDDIDPDGDREADQLARLDDLAADHLGASDRLLYHQVLRSGLPIAQVAPGVGLSRQAASERVAEVVRRLRILAAAPELPTLADTLAALASHGHADDLRAAWMHGNWQTGRQIGRALGLSSQRVTDAIRRGLAVAEEHAHDVAEAGELVERVAYRRASGWAVARAPRTQARRQFERAMEAA